MAQIAHCQNKNDAAGQQANAPLVSVIVPAYNAEPFIEKTLNCVLQQSYQKFEVLVVDDGSHDRTAEVVAAIAQRDSRVKLLKQPNRGVASARNLALQQASGEIIAPLDADDLWHPQNLAKQIQCLMTAGSAVGLVYAWSFDIDGKDQPLGGYRISNVEGHVYATLVCHNFIGNASAAVIRRSCLTTVGGYDCQFREHRAQGCEDWDLYLRIAEQYQFRVVPEFLIGYRKHNHNMSQDYVEMARSHSRMLQTVHRHHPHLPRALYALSTSSFYLYLARQCDLRGGEQETLFWLHQALKADCLTPWLRYGFYLLLIKSILRVVTQAVNTALPIHWLALKATPKHSGPEFQPTTVPLFHQRGLGLRFKLAVECLLHYSLTTLLEPSTCYTQSKSSILN